MKTTLFSAIFAVVAFPSFSQITVSDADFPSSGDTVLVSVSDDFSLDFSTTGVNTAWDFSTLNIASQRVDEFYSLTGASITYQVVFNNQFTEPEYDSDYYQDFTGIDLGAAGQFGVTIEDPVQFVKISSSKLENVGMGMKLNGVEVPAKSDTIDVQYELPMNFSDTWTARSYTNLDLNPAFNGIFRRHQLRNSEVDGWGTITTPFGTFDAIRVRSEIISTDSIFMDLGGLGGQWFEIPTPIIYEYHWITNGEKMPVLKVTTNDNGTGEQVVSVEFPDFDRGLVGVGIEENSLSEGQIFPNPTDGMTTLVFDEVVDQLVIQNSLGQVVYQINVPNNIFEIDLSHLESGVYLVVATKDSQTSVQKLVVN